MTFPDLFSLPPRYILSYILLAVSALCYGIFWIWGMVHAASTPKASLSQRLFWSGSILLNPSSTVWYWYIWKRWAFWLLFTPIFGFFVSLPFVVKSVLTRASETQLTNTLFALGTQRLVVVLAVLMIFPLVLRLVALLHLARNTHLSAMDRNDWVVALAFPIFGFGAGLAYTARYQRTWALVSLGWWIILVLASRLVAANLSYALVPVGEERRIEFRATQNAPL